MHPRQEQHQAMLHELAELTLAMARQLVALATREAEQATSATPKTPTTSPQDYALALERVARATRRTINLAHHLAQAPEQSCPNPANARKQVIRSVEDAILRAEPKPEHARTLRAELMERLDAPELADEFHEDLATRPIDDIIRDIVRDLNVTPDDLPWPRRSPSDLRNLLAQANNRSDHPGPTPDPLFTATWPGPKRKPRKTYTQAELAIMPDEILDTLEDDEDADEHDGNHR